MGPIATKAVVLFAFMVLAVACQVPQHIYLSYSGDVTNMRVTWTTTAWVYTQANVHWWEHGQTGQGHIVAVIRSNIQNFTRPNNMGTQFITTITCGLYTKLISKANYTYQIRLDENDSATWSAVYDFVALPNYDQPVTLGIYGDLGAGGPILSTNNATGLKSFARNHYFDMILHNGDLAYNLGTDNGLIGEQFMSNIQEISARVPYTVSLGNHEYMDSGVSNAYYNGYWKGQTLLGTASGSTNPLAWYSFNISFAHIVVINTEVYCEDKTKIADQWNWLKNDLSTYRAAHPTNWIFVIGHRQIYLGTTGAFDSYYQRFGLNCTNPNDFSTCNKALPCFSNAPNCGYAIEPLFFQYNVDFSFEGHQHLYQRFYPIGPSQIYETQALRKYVNPKYPVHVISGCGGMQNHSTGVAKRDDPMLHENSKRASPHVAVTLGSGPTAVTTVPSYTVAKIYNLTHVYFQQIATDKSTPIDNFWVVKDSSQPAWTSTGAFTVSRTTATYCQ